ncbi:MAG TPA: SUMF1/EgtB/PvdO family nonheme iron enzyme, partial [Pirellulales bacterium]|nr:SUMF1/EgtB/PvdO family nonheme iron enzyme [Pirellulales bacterium]
MSSRRCLGGVPLSFILLGQIALAVAACQAVCPSELFADDEAQPPGKWALLIGVDQYMNLPGLKLAGADARDLAARLVTVGFAADQVFVLRDDADKDLLPTKDNIERQLKLLLDPEEGLVKKGDLVIVSFSGHGMSKDRKSYLCPTEANRKDPAGTMIRLENLYRQIAGSRAEYKLLVVDAYRGDSTTAPAESTMPLSFFNSLRKVPHGLMLLSSCGPGQRAFDAPALKHSVFMSYMIAGLSSKAARGDGALTLMGLYSIVGPLTRKHTLKEFKTLQYPVLEGKTDGVFELARFDREPPKETKPAKQKSKTGKVADNNTITNSIGMKLTLIPAGEFMMGSPETEFGAALNHEFGEALHRVRITRPFYMGVHEVTQAQYQTIMGNNPSEFSTIGAKKSMVGGLDTSRFPVESVSTADAQEFCRRLEEKEGKHYRLPTEAEWEYACRAGTSGPFSFGATCNGNEANLNGTAPYGKTPRGPYLDRPTKVGSYSPNAFGLYDMHGNVWELCSDWYFSDFDNVPVADDPTGPPSGTHRVSRGGGWLTDPANGRSASR